jgi:hypothetical protein
LVRNLHDGLLRLDEPEPELAVQTVAMQLDLRADRERREVETWRDVAREVGAVVRADGQRCVRALRERPVDGELIAFSLSRRSV